jgi:EmrB/QacA subfamily drug resistance transporter
LTETTEVEQTAQSLLDSRRWWALVVLSASLLVVTVGNATVNIAIPVLARELDATTQDLQWVAAAYGLALAGLLFAGGALGDRFGRKRALMSGLALYLAVSLVAAWSGSLEMLIAARALMGVAAALVLPSSLAILIDTFPPHERVGAISIWASALGIGGALAPVATGLVLANADYEAIFLIGVPLIVVAMGVGAFVLRSSRDPERAPVDVLGGLLSTAGITLVVFGIVEAPRAGLLSATTGAAFVVGSLLLAVFVRWQLSCANPVIDVHLFRNATFVTGVAGTAFLFLAMQGVMFLTAQHLQIVTGHSPLVAGLVNIPWGVIVFCSSLASGRVANRFGHNRTVAFAAMCISVSLVVLALLLDPGLPLWEFVAVMCGFHLGFGLGMGPLTVAIMRDVPARRAGGGGALNSFAREFGGALGVAAIGSIAASTYAAGFARAALPKDGWLRDRILSSVGEAVNAIERLAPVAVRDTLGRAARSAFDSGFAVSVLAIAAGALALAVAASLCLPRERGRRGGPT